MTGVFHLIKLWPICYESTLNIKPNHTSWYLLCRKSATVAAFLLQRNSGHLHQNGRQSKQIWQQKNETDLEVSLSPWTLCVAQQLGTCRGVTVNSVSRKCTNDQKLGQLQSRHRLRVNTGSSGVENILDWIQIETNCLGFFSDWVLLSPTVWYWYENTVLLIK